MKQLIISKGWTLFLDRDGVINKRLPGDYVKSISEFQFLPNVEKAFQIFERYFNPIVVVTNQQGIGKGIMTHQDFDVVTQHMQDEVKKMGGHINHVFYSPDLKNTGSKTRKPEIGMGLQAKEMYPPIDFSKSIMVGDRLGDVKFGKGLGMTTVIIGHDDEDWEEGCKMADFSFNDLWDFAQHIEIKDIAKE